MIKFILIFFLISSFVCSQNVDSTINPLHTEGNIFKFAEYLFCQKDYLRSAVEYLRLREESRNEEVKFKIALSFSIIGDYPSAKRYFEQIKENSSYYKYSRLEILKILLLEENYSELNKYTSSSGVNLSGRDSTENKILFTSYLRGNQNIPSFENFIKPFDRSEQDGIALLYNAKSNPSHKSPITALILSAIIPGAGKLYTGEISDGIIAFISTGLFAFLAYDNFKANHDFRGWLFTGLAAGFYGGNVYGSFASAQIYNARIKYEFNLQLDSFLKSKNYFIPEYDFCK